MHYKAFVFAALAAGAINPVLAQRNRNNNGQQGGQGNQNLCLDQSVLSKASEADGQAEQGSEAGQAASITSNNNFIDFCKGKTITNGQQNKDGSCNPIPQGDIPAVGNMVSTVITSPQAGEDIAANKDFTVKLQTQNLQAGSFTNPTVTYYSAPQQLNAQGQTIGHAHVSIQDMGGTMNPSKPLDPQKFAFFKGINDNGNGNGELSATVTGGLPAGTYRVCTIMSSSNHLGVISPVAQRGVQDDCQKFTVGQGGGGGGSGSGNTGSGQDTQAATQQQSGNQGGQQTGRQGSQGAAQGVAQGFGRGGLFGGRGKRPGLFGGFPKRNGPSARRKPFMERAWVA